MFTHEIQVTVRDFRARDTYRDRSLNGYQFDISCQWIIHDRPYDIKYLYTQAFALKHQHAS